MEYTDATVEIYDMLRDTLYVDPVNPHQAVDFTSFIYEDNLYVVGGAVKENVFSNKIHTLNLQTGVWYAMEDEIPAEYCGRKNGVLIGDKVYFFGGYRTIPQWEVVSYDLQTGEWKHLCDLRGSVAYPGLASRGNLVYIFEGRDLQVYNVKTNTVEAYKIILSSEATEETEIGMESSGLFYSDDKLYIVGGCNRSGDLVTPSAAIYSVDVSRISR